MKNIIKWLAIIGGVFFVLLIAVSIIFVKSFDVKKYKPEIEQAVSKNTGRTLTLGGDMDVSIFPWVGVKLLDVHFSNPEGFAQADMVSVDRFEVRLKLLPLLTGDIQVKTFVLDRPEIYLEKGKNGQANWMGIGKKSPSAPDKKSSPSKNESPSFKALPIESLYVGNFSITNGKVTYVDQVAGKRNQMSDFNLNVANISLENPIDISLSAKLDGKPVSLNGSAGPLGKDPAKGTLLFDVGLSVLDELNVSLKGSITEPAGSQKMDVMVSIDPFSPRKIFKALGQQFPVQTKDPTVLDAIAFNARINGTKDQVNVSDGVLTVDDSKLLFKAAAKEFDRPNIAFDIKLDSMDLDRYLPETQPKKSSGQTEGQTQEASGKAAKKKTDYTPLRKLILDGKISAGKLIAHGAMVENIIVKMDAKNGIISMDPVQADLYNGNFLSTMKINVQKDRSKTTLLFAGKNIQVGPLLKDAMQKELIEGTLNTDIGLSMSGQTPEEIKKTLNGKGELLFLDGAIVGIDLANAVRNVKANLGVGEKLEEKPRTDFAELKMPFTAKNGLVNTKGTSLASPLLRVLVRGNIDLVKALMDLRIDPKFVATLKGQGDTKQRSGLMVPVLITGSFAEPKVRPDLKGMLTGGKDVGIEDLTKAIGSKEEQKKTLESTTEDVKKQIKGVIPGLFE